MGKRRRNRDSSFLKKRSTTDPEPHYSTDLEPEAGFHARSIWQHIQMEL